MYWPLSNSRSVNVGNSKGIGGWSRMNYRDTCVNVLDSKTHDLTRLGGGNKMNCKKNNLFSFQRCRYILHYQIIIPVFSYWFNGVSFFKRRMVGNSIGKSISNAIQVVKYPTCNIPMKTCAFQNGFLFRKVAFPTTWDVWWDWNIAIPKVQTTHVQPGPAGMHHTTNFRRL